MSSENDKQKIKKIVQKFDAEIVLLKKKQKEVIEKNVKIVEKRKMDQVRKKIL